MDMKYAVLLMVELEGFWDRFKLGLLAHNCKLKEETIEIDVLPNNSFDYIQEHFVNNASILNTPLTLVKVPFAAGPYFVCHDNRGIVTALFEVTYTRYGLSEFRTMLRAITVKGLHRTIT